MDRIRANLDDDLKHFCSHLHFKMVHVNHPILWWLATAFTFSNRALSICIYTNGNEADDKSDSRTRTHMRLDTSMREQQVHSCLNTKYLPARAMAKKNMTNYWNGFCHFFRKSYADWSYNHAFMQSNYIQFVWLLMHRHMHTHSHTYCINQDWR